MKNYVYEIWKPVKGYEGLYEVSNFGRVKSLCKYDKSGHFRNEKILVPIVHRKRYLHVNLYKDGKRKSEQIHRLVAEAFIPNPDNLPQVNHKGENPSKNFVWQLEWCDCYYNNNFGNRNKNIANQLLNGKKSKPVLQYDLNMNLIREYSSIREVERQTGLSNSSLSQCCNNKRKTCNGFIWKFKNNK